MAVRTTSEVLTAGEYIGICTALVDDEIEYMDRQTGRGENRRVIRFRFALDGGDAGIQEQEAVAWTPKFSELSKAGQFAKELMGWQELPKGAWDDEQLIGRPCFVRIKVDHKETEDGPRDFLKLDSIRSVPAAISTSKEIRESVANLRDYAGLDTTPPGEEPGRNAGEPDDDDAEATPPF